LGRPYTFVGGLQQQGERPGSGGSSAGVPPRPTQSTPYALPSPASTSGLGSGSSGSGSAGAAGVLAGLLVLSLLSAWRRTEFEAGRLLLRVKLPAVSPA
jgi:hypothetical protein